jgi:uncharacterized protein YndB with AHSA1/START domain
MTKTNPTTIQSASDREIVIARTFDAPRELVWEAWTRPEHIAKWWGPNGFTTTIEEFDLRPGGRFKHVMRGPDGASYPNLSLFREVVALERIVYSHGGGKQGGVGAHFEATWTFEALGEKRTRVTGRLIFPTAQDRDFVVEEYGAIEGGRQTLARLAEHVARSASAGEELVIVRDLACPRERVYAAWTGVEHLRHWWGPQGFAVESAKLDLCAGGTFHYGLRAPDGGQMWGKFVFREVRPPERIVWVNSFSDPKGGTRRHPGHMAWPLEMLIDVTFLENNGGTTLTLRSRPLNATEAERQVFREGHDSMRGGFGGTFDRLQHFLGDQRGAAR